MDIVLRAVLIVVSIIATRELLVRIRKSRMQIEDSVFWVLLAFLCILLALFPRVLYFFTDLLNMRSPANLLFMFMIAMLLYKCFQLSMHISVLEERIRTLAQDQALEKLAEEERTAEADPAKRLQGEAKRKMLQAKATGIREAGAAAKKNSPAGAAAAERTAAAKVPEVSE